MTYRNAIIEISVINSRGIIGISDISSRWLIDMQQCKLMSISAVDL